MNETSSIHPDEAASALDSIRSTRAATRERLGSQWLALVVFGALTFLSAPLYDVRDGAAAALFWLAAAPIGTFVVARHRRAQLRSTGAARAGQPYARTFVALGVAFFVLSAAGALTGKGEIAVYGPPFAVGAAYLVFAALDRRISFALWGMVVAAVAILLVVIGSDGGAGALATGLGGSLVLHGLAERSGRPYP